MPTPLDPERPFELVATAGRGAVGEVYRARQGDGFVALKIGLDASCGAALAHELEALLLAASPSLPRALWAGWVLLGGDEKSAAPVAESTPHARPAIAVEWVQGTPLAASSVSGEAAALRVAASVAGSLAMLHTAGFAHGDLSASNVLLRADGDATVIDLGLATSRFDATIRGATPRYLARGDADLGTAEARDLLALGLLVAEIARPELKAEADLLAAARRATLPGAVAALAAALLAPQPHARPSSRWVAERARAALGSHDGFVMTTEHRSSHDAALVRAGYARLRRAALHAGGVAPPATARWLAEILAWSPALASVGRRERTALARAVPLAPLDATDLARWLVALVGPRAAGWPLAGVVQAGEERLADALVLLAEAGPPLAWTYRDLTRALESEPPSLASRLAGGGGYVFASGAGGAAAGEHEPTAAARAAALALALAAAPPSDAAVDEVERAPSPPVPLALAAARALAVRGEPGRALALASRCPSDDAPARALVADIRRRAGDSRGAEEDAQLALGRADATGDALSAARARAVLARLLFDAGDHEAALARAAPFDAAQTCEVGALAHAALGRHEQARSLLETGVALATDAESRARLVGARAYVLAATDPREARRAFTIAVDEAARAGATVEEATYLTGAAATAVDEGYLEQATVLGERAALLWEALGRPRFAARALLARAAAFATARMAVEAESAAARALSAASDAGDRQAALYALFAMADVRDVAARAAVVAEARALVADLPGDTRADTLRAAARALAIGLLDGSEITRLDDLGVSVDLPPASRFEWWGARAEAVLDGRAPSRGERPVEALVVLADVRCELSARGPALAAGARLAASLGLGDAALRLQGAARRASQALASNAGALADAVYALPWLDRAAPDGSGASLYDSDQIARLEHLVRSLAGNEDLGDLMRQVLDALVVWTGVERGLFLLRLPNGTLAPRAARNLARHDLRGEQLALSRSLAQRALDERGPVVAVDAAGELPDVHRSVHALRLRSVLAVPLFARGEPIGVVYLDDRVRRGAFGERELSWVRTLASLASGMIAAAMGQVQAEKDVRRSERARRVLERSLAERDVRLTVLETELGKVSQPRGLRPAFDAIIGESEPFVRALSIADRVATADIPVLLVGESGSGKELFARAIHEASPRRGHPFVSENCGAIPETLLESTLFGHVRGAFTGADRTRVGLFEAADGGTLFLDEVGEMSLGMQAKLLRILEEGIVRPVGSERSRKVDVRILAATHRDLEAMVARKEFREDLYYRMSIVTLRVPALRERRDDVPLLVKRFVDKHAAGQGVEITAPAMRRLAAYAWPGNVRQLENEIRRAIVLSEGVIDVEHLSPDVGSAARPPEEDLGLDVKRRVDHLEAELVREALSKTHGNQTKAAQLLGLSRFGLQKMMKRLAISVP
ncbi:MAG: sigma 54-interacting transcriptional regulator [Myxococcales bacterium]|nr:sigma 54-interacting transcriptional regulator [Myxococcales bacterium]